MFYVLLVVLLVLALLGAPPVGLVSYGWGPSGVVGVILVILLIWVLAGRV